MSTYVLDRKIKYTIRESNSVSKYNIFLKRLFDIGFFHVSKFTLLMNEKDFQPQNVHTYTKFNKTYCMTIQR